MFNNATITSLTQIQDRATGDLLELKFAFTIEDDDIEEPKSANIVLKGDELQKEIAEYSSVTEIVKKHIRETYKVYAEENGVPTREITATTAEEIAAIIGSAEITDVDGLKASK